MSRSRKNLLVACASWSALVIGAFLVHDPHESFLLSLGPGLWPVLAINSFANAVLTLELLAVISPRVQGLLRSRYWSCVGIYWAVLFAVVIAAIYNATAGRALGAA